MKCHAIFGLVLLSLTAGCFTETRSFSLTVKNDWDQPVTICVTKTHSPPEQGWESPEELIAPPHPPSDQTPPGALIQPGQTATRPEFKGSFDPARGRAYLRIYAGKLTLSQMNAISPGNPDRMDIVLEPGPNRIEIRSAPGDQMTALRITGAWPTTH
jgi:hypothetical protein